MGPPYPSKRFFKCQFERIGFVFCGLFVAYAPVLPCRLAALLALAPSCFALSCLAFHRLPFLCLRFSSPTGTLPCPPYALAPVLDCRKLHRSIQSIQLNRELAESFVRQYYNTAAVALSAVASHPFSTS